MIINGNISNSLLRFGNAISLSLLLLIIAVPNPTPPPDTSSTQDREIPALKQVDSEGEESTEADSGPLDDRSVADNFVESDSGHREEKAESRFSNRKRMFCFGCNRPDGHAIAGGNRFFYSFLLGLTFGLIYLVGPYRCQCCGTLRLFRFNRMNPRYWFHKTRQRSLAKGISGRRKRR